MIPPWNAPLPTTADLDWAQLRTIELSLLDSPDPTVVANLIATTKAAIKEDGFLYVTDYGVSLSQLHRQFALAQYLHANITARDKERLLWNPESGLFAGFKPRAGWKRKAGEEDGIEQFNFYSKEFRDPAMVPECILPFMDEIVAFGNHLRDVVTRKLLVLLSRVLELPDDWLWENVQSKDDTPVGEGYLRHALFHPLDEQLRQKREAVRMYGEWDFIKLDEADHMHMLTKLPGHRDYGSLTLLFSVPVTALQVFSRDKKWRFVKYNPGSLVVNLGEALEIISGGHFKATLHKVADTPPDQQHLHRLSLVMFNASRGDLRLRPAMESPLLCREGVFDEEGVMKEWKAVIDAGLPVPTNKQWREAQVSTRSQVAPKDRLGGIKVVNGVKYGEDSFMGVKVLLPA